MSVSAGKRWKRRTCASDLDATTNGAIKHAHKKRFLPMCLWLHLTSFLQLHRPAEDPQTLHEYRGTQVIFLINHPTAEQKKEATKKKYEVNLAVLLCFFFTLTATEVFTELQQLSGITCRSVVSVRSSIRLSSIRLSSISLSSIRLSSVTPGHATRSMPILPTITWSSITPIWAPSGACSTSRGTPVALLASTIWVTLSWVASSWIPLHSNTKENRWIQVILSRFYGIRAKI